MDNIMDEQYEHVSNNQKYEPSPNGNSLLHLPLPIILSILQQLSVTDLCSASRTCLLLSKIAAHSSLWPSFKHDGWATWDVRCTLARALHLPPQAFHVQLDVKRSRKFPITVPLHNLRPILNITDTEGLADRVSKAVQDQVSQLSVSLWRFSSWRQYPPAASIGICRADRSTVRASLRPEAVVPMLVHQLQQAGWPPQAAAGSTAGAHSSSTPHFGAPMGSSAGQLHGSRLRTSATAALPITPLSGARDSSSNAVLWVEAPPGADDASAAAPAWQDSLCSSTSSSVARLMMACLQECRSRLAMLADGQLPQVEGLACNSCSMPRRASSPGSGEPRERLAALQLDKPTPPRIAEATAGKMPNCETAKSAAAGRLTALGLTQQAAERLAPAAVRLLNLAAAADPSEVTFSLPGKPGWLLALWKACKVLFRLHELQQICCCTENMLEHQGTDGQILAQSGYDVLRGQHLLLIPPRQLSLVLSACSSHMERAWSAAAGAELQLCLAGLQEFPRMVTSRKCSPATLFKCLISLEAAATEYAADDGRRAGVLEVHVIQQQEKSNMVRVLQASEGVLCRHELPVPQELVRSAMHVEALRSMSWVLWLLGFGSCLT